MCIQDGYRLRMCKQNILETCNFTTNLGTKLDSTEHQCSNLNANMHAHNMLGHDSYSYQFWHMYSLYYISLNKLLPFKTLEMMPNMHTIVILCIYLCLLLSLISDSSLFEF